VEEEEEEGEVKVATVMRGNEAKEKEGGIRTQASKRE